MADLFDSKENLFVKVAKFEELFPQLEDAVIEWREEGEGVFHLPASLGDQYEHKASLKQYGEVLRCSNLRCKQGGFGLHPQIIEMVRARETTRSGQSACKGRVAGPTGADLACPNRIDYKITLTYKE
jgi:hypothetical protein